LDKLQGEWTIVSEEQFGKKLPGAKIERYTLTIKGDQWTMALAEDKITMTLKIDPSKDPKTIDLTFKLRGKQMVSLGIYKLEGGTLTVCRSLTTPDPQRPKEFKTTEKDGMLVVYKRVKK
jgi:uncharacterized protein (TIGR03067 family)